MATTTTVDVSKWQTPSSIDWDSLIKNGLNSIIIQLSHGTNYEPQAKEFIAKANELGIKWHGYHFYEGVDGELEFSVQNAQDCGLPNGAYLFLDMEGNISGNWSDIFESFKSSWLQHGWHPGLYVSDSPYQSRFDNDKLVNDGVYRWIASYSYEPSNYDIWQFSNGDGKLDNNYDKSGKLSQDYTWYEPHDPDKSSAGDDTSSTSTNDPSEPPSPVSGAYVGVGKDSSGYGGGDSYGYSTDGKNFYAAVTPFGFIFRKVDADRMWNLLKNRVSSTGFSNSSNKKVSDYTDGVTYEFRSASDLGIDIDAQGALTTKVHSGYAIQTFETMTDSKPSTYTRTASNGVWNAWTKLGG